jgi:hypothetical protein
MTLEDLAKESEHGLTFEIVALRDIQPGEEVFMDYGTEWEEAWEKHVANWKPPDAMESFVAAKEANEKDGAVLSMLVSGDLREEVQHPYLFTGCQYWASSNDAHEFYMEEDPEWRKLEDKYLLRRFADDGNQYGYSDSDKGRSGYASHSDASHWPCTVLRQEENGTYTVRIHQNRFEDQQPWDKNDLPRLLKNYPRDSIRYFVKPYMSDQHLPGVFRHPIGIRDEVFPAHWKNLAKEGR